MDFHDQVAVITGSSRGIGREVARRFAGCGAHVVINYRSAGGSSQEKAHQLVTEIEQGGTKALAVQADISSREGVQQLIQSTRGAFGRLDHLVLNAARAPFKPIEKLLEREIQQLVQTNFTGQLLCIKEALPLLTESRGTIIFISSLGSRLYTPAYPLGLMKAAMEAAVRHLSESLRDRSIRVNAVCGGIVKTDSFKVLRQYWETLDRIPESLCVTPEEIAGTVLFLCSPWSAGLRGQTLVVDRGLSNQLYV